jgi:hypothetical protein
MPFITCAGIGIFISVPINVNNGNGTQIISVEHPNHVTLPEEHTEKQKEKKNASADALEIILEQVGERVLKK